MTITDRQQSRDSSESYEQLIVAIMRRLPGYRMIELLDFARFLETQAAPPQPANLADDAWERVLAAPDAQRLLREMVSEAREDYHAGRTTALTITDAGELAPA